MIWLALAISVACISAAACFAIDRWAKVRLAHIELQRTLSNNLRAASDRVERHMDVLKKHFATPSPDNVTPMREHFGKRSPELSLVENNDPPTPGAA